MEVGSYLNWAYASDCMDRMVVSSADIRRTDFAFTTSLKSYMKPTGNMAKGMARFHEKNQLMFAEVRGACAFIAPYIETSPYRPYDLIEIIFTDSRT